MKKIFTILCLAAIGLTLSRCKDPLENVTLNITGDVINYSTVLQIEDGNGSPVNDIQVSISGADGDHIYNMEGYKQFTVAEGTLVLGVDPSYEPTADRPTEFVVELRKSGYLTQKVPVTISMQQAPAIIQVNMLDLNNLPIGVAVSMQTEALVNNATTRDLVFQTRRENYAERITTVRISRGTQFHEINGNLLEGSTLNSTLITLDAAIPEALAVFPGGSLIARGVRKTDGIHADGVFNPAAVSNIDFTVGGGEVRGFSQAINVAMEIDPAFTNLRTGGTVQAGDQLEIYSYNTGEGVWKYEQDVSVSSTDGQLVAEFETDHLTWYMVGNFVESCNTPSSFNLTGSWLQDNFNYPFTVRALIGNRVITTLEASIMTNNNTVVIPGLPASGITIEVVRDGEVLASQAIDGACGAATTINLTQPIEGPTVSLQLYVRCPIDNGIISYIPTFYVFYREPAGSSNDGWQLLGIASNGFLNTTKLTAGNRYDFRAIWGSKTRTVLNRVVQETNEAVIGNGEGDIIPRDNALDFVAENCGNQ
ncbi:hypothetical protein [Olivibacter sp. XZL3]|uniref:hypothetical protein n=1 Tax=Olivibacter sp. XZL3 TaxID=1735116 RepID=UPI0010652397|nr:hypothetical protein [Olivibacter sp. XZL3]